VPRPSRPTSLHPSFRFGTAPPSVAAHSRRTCAGRQSHTVRFLVPRPTLGRASLPEPLRASLLKHLKGVWFPLAHNPRYKLQDFDSRNSCHSSRQLYFHACGPNPGKYSSPISIDTPPPKPRLAARPCALPPSSSSRSSPSARAPAASLLPAPSAPLLPSPQPPTPPPSYLPPQLDWI
jgi:hypothetical protein